MNRKGFTLIEVMIALVVLAVLAVGALSAIVAAKRDLTDGQFRQFKTNLADARWQRVLLQKKDNWNQIAVAPPATGPRQLDIGANPWVLDPSPPLAGDLSTGSFFEVTPTGVIRHWSPASGTPASCADTTVPEGIFCREVLVTTGVPFASNITLPAGASAFTVWVRVSRRGEAARRAVTRTEVFVQ